jgi:hypothetical protein
MVTVVRGRSTYRWSSFDEPGCWGVARTATGLAGDPVQGRDLQAATRAREAYAPGTGPYAPDLTRGDLVLARALVTLDARPQFGVPAWATAWDAQRLVEWLIHRRSGRVVAMQAWSPYGLDRRYRIAPSRGSLALPRTRPRGNGPGCGRAGGDTRFAYGFRDGLALARRVARRLERIPAVQIHVDGRTRTGTRVRPFSAAASIALRRGRAREELVRVTAPGRPGTRYGMPVGSRTEMTTASGAGYWRLRGGACWTGPPSRPRPRAVPLSDRARVMPLEDAFFERPRRRGGLLVLRAYTQALTVDSLIDPRSMRLVGQRWFNLAERGRLRVAEVPSVPPLPAPAPRCPTRGSG